MREIKLRAFDGSDKECCVMVYSDKKTKKDYTIDYDFGVDETGSLCCFWTYDYDDSFGYPSTNSGKLDNIMQYTGLKDKNGVEIYEGDVLLQKTTKEFKKVNSCVWERKYIVEFGEHEVRSGHADGTAIGWYLRDIGNNRRKAIGDLESDNLCGYYPYEVIGNIYEIPELLEGVE